jgi:tetratricopeptide (TPR) repeat protein
LLEESVAAHRQARRLDPTVSTSVLHTYYMQGDYARALDEGYSSSDPFEARVLGAMGREAEAIDAARREEQRYTGVPLLLSFCTSLRAAFEGQPDEATAALERIDTFAFSDGEGLFYEAEVYAKLGLLDRARTTLERAIEGGFLCLPAFENDPYLAPLRKMAEWPALVERVASRRAVVVEGFNRSGGQTLLGTSR